MEPVTTFALAAALLAVVPATQRSAIETRSERATAVGRLSTPSSVLGVLPGAPTQTPTEFKIRGDISQPQQYLVSPQESLKREVAAYRDLEAGWNGSDFTLPTGEVVDAALEFLEKLPSRLPLPRPMLSYDGELGLYWDLVGGYVEVSFDSRYRLTYFSRDTQGHEEYREDIDISYVNGGWYWASIGYLDRNIALAA